MELNDQLGVCGNGEWWCGCGEDFGEGFVSKILGSSMSEPRLSATRLSVRASHEAAASQQPAGPGPRGVRQQAASSQSAAGRARASRGKAQEQSDKLIGFSGKLLGCAGKLAPATQLNARASDQQPVSSRPDPGLAGSASKQQAASQQQAGPGPRGVRGWYMLRNT